MKASKLSVTIILGLMLALTAGCGLAVPGALSQPTATPAPTPQVIIVVATPTPGVAPEAIDVGEERVIAVYERVSPAVVNITTRALRQSFFFGVYPEEGTGSGFVWDLQGHIVTNYHVIEGAQSVEVGFAEGVTYAAEVVGVDPATDLAVLRVDEIPPGVEPVPLGDASQIRVGQRAIAIGNPFGQFERTLTTGVVSALNRTISIDEDTVLRHMIQTDAAINRGNSGGPLLDSFGRLIGVNSAIYSPTGTSAGVGLAIPVDTVKRVVPELIARGRYPHPWLGVLGYTVTPALARALDLPVDRGLLVAQIYRGSPAQKAGLRGAQREVRIGNRIWLIGGDIITAINGHPIGSLDELEAYLDEQTHVGDTITIDFYRGDRLMQTQAVLVEVPRALQP
ncbi:MAG: trypsin-like peptidase domain-containing protein [Anaerolineae bacterium]